MFAREDIKYEPLELPHRMELTDEDMLAEAKAFYGRMRSRHTVRDYSSRPVPRAVIEECIRTAGTAPSGANHQPWHFVAIPNPEFKHRIRCKDGAYRVLASRIRKGVFNHISTPSTK